jgi:hypothetical protein
MCIQELRGACLPVFVWAHLLFESLEGPSGRLYAGIDWTCVISLHLCVHTCRSAHLHICTSGCTGYTWGLGAEPLGQQLLEL